MASIGSTLTFSVLFTNAAGAPTDPDLVTFWLREEIDGTELQWSLIPGGAAVTPAGQTAIQDDGPGTFHVSFVARKPERHTGYWRGSGAVAGINQASEDVAFVRHSAIAAVDV